MQCYVWTQQYLWCSHDIRNNPQNLAFVQCEDSGKLNLVSKYFYHHLWMKLHN